jgi:hypothetical protein
MGLREFTAFRVREDLKAELKDIALRNGISESALSRNTLELVLCPRREPSQLEASMIHRIIKRAQEERDQLYVRSNNDGQTVGAKDNGQK